MLHINGGLVARTQLNMREVAQLAEVSVATVSRVLRGDAPVSQDTRAKVHAAAAQLGYVYNAAAGDVSGRRSTVLGVLLPMASNALFGETLHGIQDVSIGAGFSIVQGATRYDPEIEEKLVDSLLRRRVHGLILAGLTQGQKGRMERLTAQTRLPTVVVWEKPPAEPGAISYVGFDNRAASARATRHLIELGHRRIGLILGPYSKLSRTRHRLEGYCDALEEAGIAFDPQLVAERLPEPIEGREATEALMALAEPPTAIFAASDLLAVGAMRGAHGLGLTIPDDLSIVGFDDMDIAAYMTPPLTTVRVDAYRIGRLAAQILIEAKQGAAPRQYCLDSDLVIRGTTGPVSAAARAAAPKSFLWEEDQ